MILTVRIEYRMFYQTEITVSHLANQVGLNGENKGSLPSVMLHKLSWSTLNQSPKFRFFKVSFKLVNFKSVQYTGSCNTTSAATPRTDASPRLLWICCTTNPQQIAVMKFALKTPIIVVDW